MKKRAASQLNIVGVRTKQKHTFSIEVHSLLFIQNCVCPYRECPHCLYFNRCGVEAKAVVRQVLQTTHMFTDWNPIAQQRCMNWTRAVGGIINIQRVDPDKGGT